MLARLHQQPQAWPHEVYIFVKKKSEVRWSAQFLWPASISRLPSDQRQEVSHQSHYTFTVLLCQSVISVSLTQLVIFLKFSPPANKIMCYTCLRVFAKSWGRVQRKAGSLQVIKTHSRMLHHHHHVADPLYCEGEHKLIFKLCSNYKDFAALHLVCDIWCRNGNQFATDFQFGSSSASFSTKLFDDIQSLLFPEKDIFQVFISSFALLMGGWVCRGVQRETSATIWLSTGCSRGESGEWQ